MATHWIVSKNLPGCLPNLEDVQHHETWTDALQGLVDELDRDYQDDGFLNGEDLAITLPEGSFELLEAEYVEAKELIKTADPEHPLLVTYNMLHYSINHVSENEEIPS